MIKLYGVPLSTCTKRVATILREKGLPFELVTVKVETGAHKAPEYKDTMQPFGQIPVLDDDGFKLYESRAIGRYIAAKYANQDTPDLLPDPQDFQAVGIFERACSLEYVQFNPAAEGLATELVFKKFKGQEMDPAAVSRFKEELNEKLDAYDKILKTQKYLTGDHVTLADLFHLPYLELVVLLYGEAISSRTNVTRWSDDLRSRESWKFVKDGVASVPA